MINEEPLSIFFRDPVGIWFALHSVDQCSTIIPIVANPILR